jgi:magnesium chelatase family protein
MTYHHDFSDLRGLTDTVRQFAKAVQAGERILLIAGPGDGAVAMARPAVGLLPPLTDAEAEEVAATQQAVWGSRNIETYRPFRAPHHTCSGAGLFGIRETRDDDGTIKRAAQPGELELAKHGVLLLDEVTEFHRRIIEQVGHHIDESTTLIARAWPCPCGMANHPRAKSRCTCTEAQHDRWTGRLGRIVADLGIGTIIEVPHLTNDQRIYGERCPSTNDLHRECWCDEPEYETRDGGRTVVCTDCGGE